MSTSTSSSTKSNGGHAASPEDLHQEIEQLRNDIAALAGTVSEMGNAAVDRAKKKASQVPHDLGRVYEKTLASAEKEATEIEQRLLQQVREHPIQSIGLAAAIGYVAAMLSRH